MPAPALAIAQLLQHSGLKAHEPALHTSCRFLSASRSTSPAGQELTNLLPAWTRRETAMSAAQTRLTLMCTADNEVSGLPHFTVCCREGGACGWGGDREGQHGRSTLVILRLRKPQGCSCLTLSSFAEIVRVVGEEEIAKDNLNAALLSCSPRAASKAAAA